jgi:hypothetical protein
VFITQKVKTVPFKIQSLSHLATHSALYIRGIRQQQAFQDPDNQHKKAGAARDDEIARKYSLAKE